ncbi:MAG: CbbQ/NirQ/NorQ C-terminal domain-containing protein, partial [Candidatus Thiodiazotropha sp. (ex Ustalcina ferruginea)]|nr:CbbQ/NirQ/NorQ C-terminal domain-containing protein [Candidatus Thiodiazotropha sp. (ex Ustalcina ferruginea)]
FTIPSETPCAEPHAGCCGGWGLETPGYPIALEFDYPEPGLEKKIIQNEASIEGDMAARLVKFAHMTRNLKGSGLDEGASTRLLVHAAKLIASGVEPVTACRSCVAQALTDDSDMLVAVNELSASLF